MKRDMSVILSGLGYYKLSEERRKVLSYVFIGSLLIHLIALAVFGGWIVIQHFKEEETVFVAPPPVKTYKPKQLEHKVKVQKRQKSSSRPTMMPRMVSAKPSDFALPAIEADPKVVKTTFKPNFKPVTGIGLGVGMGTGHGMSGFGQGVSDFNFFGIRGRGDKIAVLVDVSHSMVAEDIGGEESFQRVRESLNEVIDALNRQTLFNVIVFADAASSFRDTMVIAGDEEKQDVKAWLAPFNRNGNYGHSAGNLHPSTIGLQASGGETRLDLALTAAFEQGANTILVISDGKPRVNKQAGVSSAAQTAYNQELAAWEKANAEWQRNQADALRQYQEAMKNVKYENQTVTVPVIRDGVRIGTTTETRRVPINPPRPPQGPARPRAPDTVTFWTFEDFVEHFGILHKELYEKKGKKTPTVHIIGYSIDDEGGQFLNDLAKKYDGKYRRIGKRR